MIRTRRKGLTKSSVIDTVEVPDLGGAEANTRFICRELLERMTSYVDALLLESSSSNVMNELSEIDLPLEFSSRKQKKRKRGNTKRFPPLAVSAPADARAILRSLSINMVNWSGHPYFYRQSGVESVSLVVVRGVGPSSGFSGAYSIVENVDTFEQWEVDRQHSLQQVPPQQLPEVIERLNDFERRRLLIGKPPDVPDKYWDQRFRIFSRFSDGICLDEESWYSATYECFGDEIARTAERLSAHNYIALHVVWDLFSGCGGTAIPFSRRGKLVTAIDIDCEKLKYLQYNSDIYSCRHNIEVVQQDVWDAMLPLVRKKQWLSAIRKMEASVGAIDWSSQPPALHSLYSVLSKCDDVTTEEGVEKVIDLIVLCPPWGGPDYLTSDIWDMRTMMPAGDSYLMVITALAAAKSIVMVLPRNTSEEQICEIAKCTNSKYYIQELCLNGKCKLIAVYMGAMVRHLPPI